MIQIVEEIDIMKYFDRCKRRLKRCNLRMQTEGREHFRSFCTHEGRVSPAECIIWSSLHANKITNG